MRTLSPRVDPQDKGTIAVIIFIAGAIILVLAIILILLFLKKRRGSKQTKTFIPRLERVRGGNYGKLEEDEAVWSADMEHDSGKGGKERGHYAPVHDESMGYQSQTLHHGDAGSNTYR